MNVVFLTCLKKRISQTGRQGRIRHIPMVGRNRCNMAEIDDKFKEEILNPDEKLQSFDNHGITEDYLLDKLKAELEADEEVQRRISKKEVRIFKVPIWKIRQDARKDAHKLRGDYPAEKHEHTGDVIFHSNVPEPDMPEEVFDEEKDIEPPDVKKEEHPERSPASVEEPLDVFHYEHEATPDQQAEKEIEPPEWVKKQATTPNQNQEKEFKNHHRSQREAGK